MNVCERDARHRTCGPSANLEDKSAPVGANVVIIGGGNLSTRGEKEEAVEEAEETLSENCVTEWLGLFTLGVLWAGLPPLLPGMSAIHYRR